MRQPDELLDAFAKLAEQIGQGARLYIEADDDMIRRDIHERLGDMMTELGAAWALVEEHKVALIYGAALGDGAPEG
jgi:hypothetical protein